MTNPEEILPDDDYFSLEGKKIVVLGMARQGKALAYWLPDQGAKVTVSDIRDAGQLADDLLDFIMIPDIKFALGGHPVELLDGTDLVCVSGGVPLDIPLIQQAFERGIRVTNDATLFIERCRAPIVGITGSAGKTTTTTLIGEMSKAAGRNTWVGGNIGDVLLPHLDEISTQDLVVMELSSFQLELADVSPPIAVMLNITPNHLDRHGTLEAYANAKAQIFLHQQANDLLIYNQDDLLSRTLADQAPADVAAFSMYNLVPDGACLAGNRLVLVGDCSPTGISRVICEVGEIKLRGQHNIQNILAACAVAGALGLPVDAMHEVITTFGGVPHRLEEIAQVKGATWVNDSIATSPERTMAALASFDAPIILLLGGRDKDLPWDDLAQMAVRKCRSIICFGEFGPTIARYVHRARGTLMQPHIELVQDLERAVRFAAQNVHVGDIVLLSPGGTSYDAYKDFEERGEHFRQLVNRIQRRS
jgi:UDP-N-acetylmuramoylalanine--D-glutamate ligase